MADQPAQTPAAEPERSKTPAQQPEQEPAEKPAEQPSTNVFETLSDEDKTYLKSQGIEDLSKPDSITKLINHNLSLKKASSTQQAELDKLKKISEVVTGQPTATDTTPQPGSQSQGTPQEMDAVTAFTVTSTLANNYPALKEDLETGKFYKDFQNSGRTLLTNNTVNINGLLDYAKERQHVAELEQELEKYKKPSEGSQPDANPSGKPAQIAEDAPMTRDIALAILLQDTDHTHPRYQEALQFVQGAKK